MSNPRYPAASRSKPVLKPANRLVQHEVRLPYLGALDGLRALAAIIVLLYHADIPWMPGGFLGVEAFFVLSGYLITSLLLTEWRQAGRVDLTRFWLRRVRRLFPAMLFMTAISVAYVIALLPDELAGLRRDATAGLGYLTNWYLIFNRVSYFESVGRPSLLRHLWSLAIEGQLYIVWPLVVSLVIRWWKGRWVPIIAFVGAMASAALMAWLHEPDIDPSRVYYGTDTRSTGFLLGAVLAFLPLARRSVKGAIPWLLDLAGLVSLGLLAWACVYMNAYQPLLYRGGLSIVAAETALVIAVVVRPGTRLVPGILGWRPLRWLGLRSYGIYLWHWPIFMLTRPQLDVPLDGMPLLALRFALTLLLAEISYRLVETPLRQGALGRARRVYGQAKGFRRLILGLRWGSAFLALVLALMVLGRAVANSQPSTPSWYEGKESVRTWLASATAPAGVSSPAAALPTAMGLSPEHTPSAVSQSPTATSTAAPTMRATDTISPAALVSSVDVNSALPEGQAQTGPSPTLDSSRDMDRVLLSSATLSGAVTYVQAPEREIPPSTVSSVLPAQSISTLSPLDIPSPVSTAALEGLEPSPVAPAGPQAATRVLAVGDSVMVSAADQLSETIDGLAIDASIGRQMREVIEVLQDILDAGQMGDVVIVQVGNNGYLSEKKFDEMMLVLKDVRSVLVLNCRVPRQWEATVNTVLADGVEKYSNATLVDWYVASADHPEFFWKDGMHLRPEGAEAYAELVAEHIHALAR